MNGFHSEQSMSEIFPAKTIFASAFGYADWSVWQAEETKGLFGVPDHLLIFWKNVGGDRSLFRTVACEMKLANWNRALTQAFRYKAFADYSVVVMDNLYVHRAEKQFKRFKSANVGLAALLPDGSLEWLYRPKYQVPYSNPIRRVFHNRIVKDVVGIRPPKKEQSPVEVAESLSGPVNQHPLSQAKEISKDNKSKKG